MKKKVFLFQKLDEPKEKLFDFLKREIVTGKKIYFSDGILRKYIEEGFVKIDDHIQKNINYLIKNNSFVSVTIKIDDIKRTQKPPKIEFHFSQENILFEDNYIILVNKPSGIPTHSTLDPDRDYLVAGLKRFLKKRDKKIPYIGLHHRLDKDTSGVIMFTKSKEVNKSIGNLFAKREIEKTYLAVTQKNSLKNNQSWTVKNYLAKNNEERQLIHSVKSGGDLAITDFKVLKTTANHALIEVQPKTGRTHQIRVHLFENNLPILGDVLYHKNGSEKHHRLYLHAFKLRFKHPTTHFVLEIEAPIPKDFQQIL